MLSRSIRPGSPGAARAPGRSPAPWPHIQEKTEASCVLGLLGFLWASSDGRINRQTGGLREDGASPCLHLAWHGASGYLHAASEVLN